MATLAEVARGTGKCKRFLEAAKTVGLLDELTKEGPYTIFAPTNAAFAKIDEDRLDALFADVERLKAMIAYHIVPERLSSREMGSERDATTMQGSSLHMKPEGGTAGHFVNDAHVLWVDAEADNGILHAIDEVLTVPEKAG